MSDPAVEAVLASVRAFEPYRGFTNPFAEMLHAVYRLAAPRDDADRERGVALLRSVVGTTDNAHARDLLIETQEPSGRSKMLIFWELRAETGPLESPQKQRFFGLDGGVWGKTTDFTLFQGHGKGAEQLFGRAIQSAERTGQGCAEFREFRW